MEGKLGLYDLIARLFPGAVTLLAVTSALSRSSTPNTAAAQLASQSPILFVVLAYLIGLLVYDLSSLLEPLIFLRIGGRPAKTYLLRETERSQSIVAALRKQPTFQALMGHQNLTAHQSEAVHGIALALTSDKSAKVLAIHSQYSMHRAMAMALLISAVAESVLDNSKFLSSWLLAYATTFTILLYFAGTWAETLTRIVYDTVIALTALAHQVQPGSTNEL